MEANPDLAGRETLPDHDGCIHADELVAMVEGALPPDRSEYLLGHIDRCESCAEVVAKLGAFEDERRVGRYRLERVLGAGAMGIVYRAWDPELRRHVAVKLVRPERANEESRLRMLREARSLARIGHPNVVAVHDVGEHAGQIYVTTEFVDGETLATWVTGRTRDEIVGAWIQVARGLAAAHAEGVVHRDVKPANALVGRDGRVRIGDFGLARQGAPPAGEAEPAPAAALDPRVTATGTLAGTPAYMAPEQWRGGADARSDQFAVCVAIAEALTGTRPPASEPVAVEPPALAAALTRGLAHDPEARFPTTEALADALEAAIASPAAAATPRRTVAAVAVSAAAAVAVSAAALGTWLAVRSPSASPTCEVAAVPADVWPGTRRAKLAAFAAPIDRHVAAWNAMASDVCMATTDEALRARRRRCLDGLLGELKQLLDGWDRGPPPDAMTALVAFDELEPPIRCAHGIVLAEPVPTWPQLAAIEDLRPWLESAELPALARILDDARAIGHAPFIVEVAEALALRQGERDPAAGIRTLRRTLALPLDDRSFGVATLVLARMLAPDPEDEVPKLVDAARPRVAAIGDVLLEARLDQVLANIAHARHRNDVAIAALERARRGFRIAYGEGGMQEATALIQLGLYQRDREPHGAQGKANYEAGREMFRRVGIPIPALQGTRDPEERVKEALEFLAFARKNGDQIAIVHAEYRAGGTFAVVGRREEGLAHYRAAIDLAGEIGMRDASAVQIQIAAARLLNELDRNAEAIPLARRAIERARELRVDESLADGLTELGRALIATGQVAAARAPLAESLKLRERLREAPSQRGITSFLCAIATWDVDRVRARELAHAASAATRSALDEVEDDDLDAEQLRGTLTRRLERIRRWIAAHP